MTMESDSASHNSSTVTQPTDEGIYETVETDPEPPTWTSLQLNRRIAIVVGVVVAVAVVVALIGISIGLVVEPTGGEQSSGRTTVPPRSRTTAVSPTRTTTAMPSTSPTTAVSTYAQARRCRWRCKLWMSTARFTVSRRNQISTVMHTASAALVQQHNFATLTARAQTVLQSAKTTLRLADLPYPILYIDDCARNPCNANYTNSCEDKVNAYECNCKSCDCSNTTRTRRCTLDETAACNEYIKKTPEYTGKDFYISHPYRCDWYMRCFSNRGVSQSCPQTTFFNPDYSSRPCSTSVRCNQT